MNQHTYPWAAGPAQSCENLPAPRLELRWRVCNEEEKKKILQDRQFDPRQVRVCEYFLVLPLRVHDIRREVWSEDGTAKIGTREELRVLISTTVDRCYGEPDNEHPDPPPYRDGRHAEWDSYVLGGLAVFLIDRDQAWRMRVTP